MELFGRRVGRLREEDIRRLTETKVSESRTLDFKREWPGAQDGGKALKDLALDLVAMANTVGGVVLVGVDESDEADGGDSAIAESLYGCGESFDFDAAMLRLQGILRTLVEPALVGLVVPQHLPLEGVPGGVVALGVPASPVRPHLMRDPFRMPRRGPRGKYDPDIAELRQMFTEHAGWRDRGERILAEEIARAQAFDRLHAAGGVSLLLGLIPVDPHAHRLVLRGHIEALAVSVLPLGSSARDSDITGWGNFKYTAIGLRRESTRGVRGLETTPWACAVQKDGSFYEWRTVGYSDEFARHHNGAQASGNLHVELLGWSLVSHIRARAAMLRDALHVEGPLLLLLAWRGVAGQILPVARGSRIRLEPVHTGEWLPAPIEILSGDDATDLETARRSVETLWNAAGAPGLDPSRIQGDLADAGIHFDRESGPKSASAHDQRQHLLGNR